jgi:hypothetical protein
VILDIRSNSRGPANTDVAQQVIVEVAQRVDLVPAQQQLDEETHAGKVRAVIIP